MRKRRHEEHLNHEAWAIPYADLMTLLLAFFVVMYAVSVVNEGKYRVMSESLIQAFNGASTTITAPPPVPRKGPATLLPAVQRAAAASPVALPIPMHNPAAARGVPGEGQQTLDNIESQVRRALQPLIDRKLVVVRHKQDWLEVEIRTDILFPSGVAQLSSTADSVLQNLANILAPFPNPLRVEGFTDNVPISTPQYPSNWELSAARAASVARLFAVSGVAPDRLGIIGWGDVRPLADNATAEGRNQNRRVLVVVMNGPNAHPREQGDAEHLREIAAPDGHEPGAATLATASASAPTPAAAGHDDAVPAARSSINASTAPGATTAPGLADAAPVAAASPAPGAPLRMSPDR